MGLKGEHSATKKGTNGMVDPKQANRTTATLDGPYGKKGKSPAGGNNSRLARSSVAGK